MTEKQIKKLREAAQKATPGPWGEKWGLNYPFYVDVRKPAPSLSKHDNDRPTYWRMEDALFVLECNPKMVLKLLADIEYWMKDSAKAWDKCEERRQETEKLKNQLDIAVKALDRIYDPRKYSEYESDAFFERVRCMRISREAIEAIDSMEDKKEEK